MMDIKKSILHTLAYFDVFKHPLQGQEILNFLPIPSSGEALKHALEELVRENQIHVYQDYYTLSENNDFIKDRLHFEKNADDAIPNAIKYGNLIRSFPFVKAVMVSGSLSKHVMKDDDDIDFFIISVKDRIWLCKTFLKLYKVFYLKNSYDFFCINYFISESNLFIKEQNIYTATELATLIPLGNQSLHEKLLGINQWIKEFLPNHHTTKKLEVSDKIEKTRLAGFFEKLFYGKFGLGIDLLLMNFNKLRNAIKYRNLRKEKDYQLRLRSTMEQIKVHADNNQTDTLKKLESKKKTIELRESI